MKTLSVSYISQFYYINSTGTIFNIEGYNNGDPCAVDSSSISGNIPSISVTNTGVTPSKTEKLYLDVYIEDGDTYSNNEFKKTIHKLNNAEPPAETSKTFQKYYEDLCDKEIENGILTNIDKNYDWFKRNLYALGVPKFMIKGEGYTVTGVSQIDFTKAYLTAKKNKVVQEEVQNAANKRASVFDYKVTNTVTVAKNS